MKTKKNLLTLFLMMIIIFNINSTYIFATETVEESEEVLADENIESLSENTEESLQEDEEESDTTEELPSTDFLSTDSITNVSTVNSISQMNLQLNNILCIILISIGVLLILFAIAILIRLKQ